MWRALPPFFIIICGSLPGCGGSHGETFTLKSGPYDYEIDEAPLNDCWPPENPLPIPLEALTLPIDLSVSTSAGGVVVNFPSLYDIQVFPNLSGERTNDMLFINGAEDPILVMSTSCAYATAGVAIGSVRDDNEFELGLTLTLSASRDVAGPEVTCAAFDGGYVEIAGYSFPLPKLTDPVDGSCNLGMLGRVWPAF